VTQTSGETPTLRREPAAPVRAGGRGGPLRRLGRYYREVVAELRKVVWPTRRELVTYTTVVVIFVSIVVALVAALDFAFAKAVLAVFG